MNIIENYKQTREKLFQTHGIHPQSKFVSTHGPVKNVHYLEAGKGTPLVLIHGGGSHASEWINILKPLSEHFHLYVVDQPGFGLTDKFDYSHVDYQKNAVAFVNSFISSLNLDRFSLLANSTGGFLAINYALNYPQSVEKLILIGAPAGTHYSIPLPLRLMSIKGLNYILMNTVAKPTNKNTADFHERILMPDASKISCEYLEHTTCHMQMTGKSLRTFLERVLTVKGWKEEFYIGDQLNKVEVPTRFIWGDKDGFESPENGLTKAKTIRDYKFEVVENAGHCPWLDQPERCSELIIDMLK